VWFSNQQQVRQPVLVDAGAVALRGSGALRPSHLRVTDERSAGGIPTRYSAGFACAPAVVAAAAAAARPAAFFSTHFTDQIEPS
jgi:hypothetical protein